MRPDSRELLHLNDEKPSMLIPVLQESALLATESLQHSVPGFEHDDYEDGTARHLVSFSESGFTTLAFENRTTRPGTAQIRKHANGALKVQSVFSKLNLSGIDLRNGAIEELPGFGWRVDYRQFVTPRGSSRAYRVYNGFVHLWMRENGCIFQVSSSIRRGTLPDKLNQIISRADAIAIAKALHGAKKCMRVRYEEGFSAHQGTLNPLYKITLSSDEPRKVYEYMIDALTGQVVNLVNKLHFKGMSAKAFLKIPDAVAGKGPIEREIARQVHDVTLPDLPDPSVLANQRFEMFIGKDKSNPVTANKNSTFVFPISSSKFTATLVFFALNRQFDLYEELGMKPLSRPIPVFVDDPTVKDNAYFDPENYEVHLGVGSGLPVGLIRQLAWDLGIGWHELAHLVVFHVTAGQDLPGRQGAALHESTGDCLGDLAMDLHFRVIHQKALGEVLTRKTVEADRGVVGKFAADADGIRVQGAENHATYPQDLTGEPHADGLISGGATYKLLVRMSTARRSIRDGLNAYVRLYLRALTLVPAHKVLFTDLLRAFITADQQLNRGANRKLIEGCFAKHGIRLGGKIGNSDSLVRKLILPAA